MSAQHTPGPWKIELVPTSIGSCFKIGPFPSRGAHGETFACVYADNIRIGIDYGHSAVGDELAANARLIAAAPELLEALRGLMENPHINLGDQVYEVRENEREGWDGPAVKAWSASVRNAEELLARIAIGKVTP